MHTKAKEQARKYALAQKTKYIILTNGDIHYLCNIEKVNPERIQSFPTLSSLHAYQTFQSNSERLISDPVVKSDEEHKIINANKHLIALFEKKIKKNKVWV